MTVNRKQAADRFRKHLGRDAAGFARAPGRVNLIGEHTDYNDGFVLPIAIERETLALFAPRDDSRVTFTSLQMNSTVEVNLSQLPLLEPGEPAWANYCKGVAYHLFADEPPVNGVDILFDSDVPIGGGLSSSASLEVATAKAMLASAGKLESVTNDELARLCQKAEHEFANSPCGLMDQAIAVYGKRGRALLLDCRDGDARHIPMDDPEIVVLVADTQVQHAIGGGEYAQRRQECMTAKEQLHVYALRDADMNMITLAENDGRLSEPENLRARHVVGEIDRTTRAAEALNDGDYETFGQRMYESHESLRDLFEVSCDELDTLVELARGCEGVHGARMTGGGFGGSAIVLCQAGPSQEISERIAKGFSDKFGRRCPIFATRADDGATVEMY